MMVAASSAASAMANVAARGATARESEKMRVRESAEQERRALGFSKRDRE